MKTIASVTPLPVSADSRTFKIAGSLARFGYRSLVIEGQRSEMELNELPFELFCGGGALSTKSQNLSPESKAVGDNFRSAKRQSKRLMKLLPTTFQKALTSFILPSLYLNISAFRSARALPKVSLYYLHSPYQFPVIFWLSRRHPTPIIYDAHDFYPMVIPNVFFKRWEAWCTQKAAAVVTVSKGIARFMHQEFGCDPLILRNCHDVRLEKTPAAGLRESLKLSPDTFLLVTVGQAKPGQAVAEALEALSGLPKKIHLAFLGKNTNNYKGLVTHFRLQSRVHLVPAVKQDEVVRYIRSADAALILYYPLSPQYEYCLPNGFFQSIAAELPLLYPELPEIRRLAEKYKLGIPLNPQSAHSIHEAVMQLAEGQDIVSTFKSNLRAANLALSWEQEEGILRELVERVLNTSAKEVM